MSNHNHHHHHRHNHQWQGGGGENNTNTNNSATINNGGGAGPCGACKYLRRKCVVGCVFAPYFDGEQGTVHFAAVHKVFGASNASKLLLRIPSHKRLDAVFTLCYEALSRLRDPVYGCVSHIFSLHQQVLNMQAELAFVQARLSTLQRQPETFSLDNHTTLPNCTILDDHIPPPPPPSSTSTTSVANSMPLFDNNLHSQLTPPPPPTTTTGVAELASFCNVTDNEQDGMLIEDGDLQTLTREFVSKYLPGVKFKAEPH